MAKRTRERLGVDRRYAFKLYPLPEQEAALLQQADMVRHLYNAVIEFTRTPYERAMGIAYEAIVGKTRTIPYGVQRPNGVVHSSAGKFNRSGRWRPADVLVPSEFTLGYEITALYAACPEWRELSTWTGRRVATTIRAAWELFFRAPSENSPPKFKSARRHEPWIPHRCLRLADTTAASSASGCSLDHVDGRTWALRVKGVPGAIHTRGHLPEVERFHCADAEIKRIGREWFFGVAVEQAPRLVSQANADLVIELGVLDGIAKVNGEPEYPVGLAHAENLSRYVNELKGTRDKRWPGPATDDPDWRDEDRRIRDLQARIVRIRNNALHVWTTQLVRRARSITLLMPPVRMVTASPHGNDSSWGANVETVSELNRAVLERAPYKIRQLLQYKASEAGIPFEVREHNEPEIAIGQALVAAGKKFRSRARAAKKEILKWPVELTL